MTTETTLTKEYFDIAIEKFSSKFDKVDERFDKLEKGTNNRFDKMDERFDKMDDRFNKLEKGTNDRFDEVISILARHDVTLEKHEGILMTTASQVLGIDEKLAKMNHRVGKVEIGVADLGEELKLRNKAADADSETLFHHEKRIEKLELRFA